MRGKDLDEAADRVGLINRQWWHVACRFRVAQSIGEGLSTVDRAVQGGHVVTWVENHTIVSDLCLLRILETHSW